MADGGAVRRIKATVRGRVQAVGFREFVRHKAERLGVAGYVRNRGDGSSVEVVAEGSEDALSALVRTLHEGPRFARVDGVDVEQADATGQFVGFRVAF